MKILTLALDLYSETRKYEINTKKIKMTFWKVYGWWFYRFIAK